MKTIQFYFGLSVLCGTVATVSNNSVGLQPHSTDAPPDCTLCIDPILQDILPTDTPTIVPWADIEKHLVDAGIIGPHAPGLEIQSRARLVKFICDTTPFLHETTRDRAFWQLILTVTDHANAGWASTFTQIKGYTVLIDSRNGNLYYIRSIKSEDDSKWTGHDGDPVNAERSIREARGESWGELVDAVLPDNVLNKVIKACLEPSTELQGLRVRSDRLEACREVIIRPLTRSRDEVVRTDGQVVQTKAGAAVRNAEPVIERSSRSVWIIQCRGMPTSRDNSRDAADIQWRMQASSALLVVSADNYTLLDVTQRPLPCYNDEAWQHIQDEQQQRLRDFLKQNYQK